MTFNQGAIGASTRWSEGHSDTWGPYWDVMFPPRDVTGWIDWKRGSTGVAVARRLWDRREYLRRAYESVYGTHPKRWPSRHPAVLLDGNAVCLGCRWLGRDASAAARRHETPEGAE
jgi:hypothetical protein